MATYVIGTASGGYYNNRGNLAPWAFGSSCNLGGQHINSFSLQMASNSGTTTVKGRIWNSAGNVVWTSGDVSIGQDTSPPFGAVTFSPNTYISDAYYFGFIKGTSSVNWDVVNGDNTTITGNDAISTSGTGTIYRRLVGSIDYTTVSVPAAPSVSATPGDGSITVTFSSNGDGGEGITDWQYNFNGEGWNGGAYSGMSFTGKTNGTSYTVYIRGVNVVGAGPDGSASATPRTTPSAPTSFAAANTTFGQLDLSWSAPSSNGGASISGYTLIRTAPGTVTTLLTNANQTTYSDTGLDPNVEYSYTVAAVNVAGTGSTASVSKTTMGGIGRIWNGSTYVSALPKVWNGSAWVDAQARIWNGSEWKYGI